MQGEEYRRVSTPISTSGRRRLWKKSVLLLRRLKCHIRNNPSGQVDSILEVTHFRIYFSPRSLCAGIVLYSTEYRLSSGINQNVVFIFPCMFLIPVLILFPRLAPFTRTLYEFSERE